MLTNKIATIEEHHILVGSRFKLSQIIMRRVRELMKKDAAPSRSVLKTLGIKPSDIPTHSLPKIALEELRTGKIEF